MIQIQRLLGEGKAAGDWGSDSSFDPSSVNMTLHCTLPILVKYL